MKPLPEPLLREINRALMASGLFTTWSVRRASTTRLRIASNDGRRWIDFAHPEHALIAAVERWAELEVKPRTPEREEIE